MFGPRTQFDREAGAALYVNVLPKLRENMRRNGKEKNIDVVHNISIAVIRGYHEHFPLGENEVKREITTFLAEAMQFCETREARSRMMDIIQQL